MSDCGTYGKPPLRSPLYPIEVHNHQMDSKTALVTLPFYRIAYGSIIVFPKLFDSVDGYQRNREVCRTGGLTFIRLCHNEINNLCWRKMIKICKHFLV
jgi:hypothetical protein